MYHERTYSEIARSRRHVIIAVVALVICAVLIIALGYGSQSLAREQAANSIRESIIQSAIQCCAIEGSYPSELSHLEEYYGLVINHDDYVVKYEWLGDNVAPSVVVSPR